MVKAWKSPDTDVYSAQGPILVHGGRFSTMHSWRNDVGSHPASAISLHWMRRLSSFMRCRCVATVVRWLVCLLTVVIVVYGIRAPYLAALAPGPAWIDMAIHGGVVVIWLLVGYEWFMRRLHY